MLDMMNPDGGGSIPTKKKQSKKGSKPRQAFIYDLSKDSRNQPKNFDEDVVQQNPGWVIAFVRFDNRSTVGKTADGDAIKIRPLDPMVIVNDCISLRITDSKASPFGNMGAVLKSGDINYLSAVVPGDIVFAWMHTDIDKLDGVIESIKQNKPNPKTKKPKKPGEIAKATNGFDSGLKFFGRVEAVREQLSVDQRGIKQLTYNITAHSFQELNSKVYSSKLLEELDPKYKFVRLRKKWLLILREALTKRGENVQDLVQAFFNLFLGTGPQPMNVGKTIISPNDSFILPKVVGKMLGRTTPEKAGLKYSDVVTLVQGIQKYGPASKTNTNAPAGFAPILTPDPSKNTKATQFITPGGNRYKCTGLNISQADRWNDQVIWAVLKQYNNPVINELYTCMKSDKLGRICPTIVMRQIPFTTDKFAANTTSPVTPFFSLPRWKPHPSMVTSHNLGRSNILRVNYVQIWGSSPQSEGGSGSGSLEQVQARKNYIIDKGDIKRSGVRTYVATSPHDQPNSSKGITRTATWARIISDWMVNGHLKTNGTIVMTGIYEPICPGDNIEWNGTVLHIEQVVHEANVNPMTGVKKFKTTVMVSNGLDLKSSENDTVYPNMDNLYREELAADDQDGIYPGYADVQDLPSSQNRVDGELTRGRDSGESK